ncbi:hypothetical protein [Piscinibacter sp. HJYY11]|uniref:hypothetical protein n=1 Tax=Piscinibacter sp. HJYY11 TaxID=2801333 RepID=UPI00191F9826|nr:hypothetical protein [Piscinibacter sp. HJYY11]MBL0726380.1 hypothetical protein [Piscinibacter sp. HJYY11]
MAKKKNSATSKNKQAPTTKPWLKCGECDTYAQLNKKRAKPRFERDHVPSHAAMNKAAQSSKRMRGASKKVRKCVKQYIKDKALTIAIPKQIHRDISRTCGSRNTASQISTDSGDLNAAVNKDIDRIQNHMDSTGHACAKAYKDAADEVKKQDHKKLINDAIDKCKG